MNNGKDTRFMRFPGLRSTLLRSSILGVLAIGYGLACQAQNIVVVADPAQSHVDFTVADNLHTVHGSFQLKEGKILLDPSTHKISGSLVVDVRSGDSGSHSRDQRMHKEILESERYPYSTFTAESVEGEIAPAGDSHIKVSGKLNLHGADHPMALDVLLHREGDLVTATTSFGIPFVQWGMKDPSNFLFRLEKTVHMNIEIHGSVKQ